MYPSLPGKHCRRLATITGFTAAAVALWTCPTRGMASAGAAQPAIAKPAGTARIMLTGDVMLGRGVDQILPHHCSPELYEGYVRDARSYVKLAVAANGPLPKPRGFDYPWGIALRDMEAKQPDARVINLETAVTTSPAAWPDKGINYRMHPGNVPTLTAAGIDVCCLANNHAADWGMEGLQDTLDALRSAGLATAGAGQDLLEAEAPAAVPLPATSSSSGSGEPGSSPAAHRDPATGSLAAGSGTEGSGAEAGSGGGRLLVWAVGHSSSGVPADWAAGGHRPGVFAADLSPAGVRHLAQLVRQHKRPGDVALVSVHWGSNWGFQVPAEHRRFAHALIDEAGVDIVHGHSSHHIKGAELHGGKLVIYGCGDLISDYEGITNTPLEAAYPPEHFRDDVGALWYADVSAATGRLRQLIVTPTRLKHLSLHPPEPADWRYVTSLLSRECGKPGGFSPPQPSPDHCSLMLLPAAQAEE